MKFTLSWLREHLDTDATAQQLVDAMTMAGLEVEHVANPAAKLAAFTVAKIVEAVQHPNADRLRVCQVDTVDGRKEIVCGAPNARAGLTTIYAPIGAYVPGLGVTLVEKPVRGVVSNGMLCSASELETASESDGIMELPGRFDFASLVSDGTREFIPIFNATLTAILIPSLRVQSAGILVNRKLIDLVALLTQRVKPETTP